MDDRAAVSVGTGPPGFVFTWIYKNTRWSILAVILLHSMVNITGELIAVSPRADSLAILLWIVAVVGIVAIWGPARFAREGATEVAQRSSLCGF